MIVKLFGLLDFLAALSIILLRLDFIIIISLIFGIYLIIKGLIFIKSFVSVIDLVCGGIILITYFGFFSMASWIVMVWLLQKGLFSLIS